MITHSFRVNQEIEEHLLYIKKSLGVESLSKAIHAAIELLYQDLKRKEEEARPALIDVLEQMGLIGSIEGPEDLSLGHKRYLAQGWQKKYHSAK